MTGVVDDEGFMFKGEGTMRNRFFSSAKRLGKSKVHRVCYEYESENTVHTTDTENVIQDSQPELMSFQKDAGFYQENSVYSLPHRKRKPVKGVSAMFRHQKRFGGRMQSSSSTSSSHNNQKSGRVERSLVSRGRHLSSPRHNLHSRHRDFDKQLLSFLADSSKGGDGVPFIHEDVIPATPEKSFQQFSNTVNRRMTFVAVIKKQKALYNFDQTVNNENDQKNKTASDRLTPLKNIQIKLVPLDTNNTKSDDDMPRAERNTPIVDSNKESQRDEIHESSKQSSTTANEQRSLRKLKINLTLQESSKSRKLRKLNAVEKLPNQEVIETVNELGENSEKDQQIQSENPTKASEDMVNITSIKTPEENYIVADEKLESNKSGIMKVKITRPKKKLNKLKKKANKDKETNLKDSERAPVVVAETQNPRSTQELHNDIQGPADDEKTDGGEDDNCRMVAENVQAEELVVTKKKKIIKKRQTTKDGKTDEDVASGDQHQGVVKEMQSQSNAIDEIRSDIRVPLDDKSMDRRGGEGSHEVGVEERVDLEDFTEILGKEKDMIVKKGKAKRGDIKKIKNAAKQKISARKVEVETKVKKLSPVKKRLRRKVADCDAEPDVVLTKKRKQSPRKEKDAVMKHKEKDDETNTVLDRTTSKTSVTSFKMCTRSQSAHSLMKASQKSHGDPDVNVDEFFKMNCTINDRNVVEDPETIRRMNASSSEDSDNDVIVKRPKRVASKNNEISAVDSPKRAKKEIVENLEKTPDKNMKQLHVSVARSPFVEKMMQSTSKTEDEIDAEKDSDEEMISRSNNRASSTTSKKRRLYSDKFTDFSGTSDSESPKPNKTVDKSKRISTEAAKVYLDIEEERRKALQPGPSKVNNRKRKKIKVEEVKIVQVPKTLEPSNNANFSYRRCAQQNMTDREKKLSDLFDMLKGDDSQNNNYYSKFDDDVYGGSQNLFKAKKRNKTNKKPPPKGAKKAKKGASGKVEDILTPHNFLADERVRSVPPLRSSDECISVENQKILTPKSVPNSPEVVEQAMEMIPPNDECVHENILVDVEPNIDIELADDKENETRGPENVIINETESNDGTQKSNKSVAKYKSANNSGKTTRSKKTKLQAAAKKIQHVVPESESCEMNVSLPPLTVETVQENAPKDDSLAGVDFNKIKAMIGDVTFESVIGADCERSIDSVAVSVIPDNATNIAEDVENYPECPPEVETVSQSKTVNNVGQTPIADSRKKTCDPRRMMNIEKDLDSAVQGKQQTIHSIVEECSKTYSRDKYDFYSPQRESFVKVTPVKIACNENVVRDVTSSDSEPNFQREKQQTVHSEVDIVIGEHSKTYNKDKYDFYSPRREAMVQLTPVKKVASKNIVKDLYTSQREAIVQLTRKNIVHDISSDDDDSDESNHSIILSSKSQRTQATKRSSVSDVCDMFDLPAEMKSKIPTFKTNNKGIDSNLMNKISEVSIHKSVHSTPKSVTSIDCAKYLTKQISPLRFSPRQVSQMEKHPRKKIRAIEGGGVVPIIRKSPKKVVSYLTQLKKVRNPASSSNIGDNLTKGLARSVSRASTASGMTAASSVADIEPVTSQERNTIRSGAFFVPKSHAEKRYRSVGCNMRTNMDTWLTSLATMEQKILMFKEEICLLKQGLPNNCCVRHRKNK